MEKAFYLSKNELYYDIFLGKDTSSTSSSYKTLQIVNNPSYKSSHFTIDSIPQGAKVFINNGYKGTTPLELDFNHQGHKILLIFAEKQKTFYLNKDQLHYQINLEQNQNYTSPKIPIQTPPSDVVNNHKKEYGSYYVVVIISIITTLLFFLLLYYNLSN